MMPLAASWMIAALVVGLALSVSALLFFLDER